MNLCDEFVTSEEVLNTIKQLTKGKSPGRDGLTAEFYQKFRCELAPILEFLYNNILLKNHIMSDLHLYIKGKETETI